MSELTKAMEYIALQVETAKETIKNGKTLSKLLDDGWVACMIVLVPVGAGAMLITIDADYLPDTATSLFMSYNEPNESGVYDLGGDYRYFQDYQNALNEYEKTEL